jgi:hypothetical protein
MMIVRATLSESSLVSAKLIRNITANVISNYQNRKGQTMPMYRVFEVQEEIVVRKWRFDVKADSEDEAVEKAMNGECNPIDCGSAGEPEYVTWGWSSRPTDVPTDDSVWDEALADLEARRMV